MWPCNHSSYVVKDKGFTLIELIMVLLLVGLASSVIFVAVSGGLFSSSKKKFIRDFTDTLSRAKIASLGKRRVSSFLIDGENRRYCLEGHEWKDIPTTVQISGSGLSEKEDGVFAVVFYPDGSSSGGEIDLEHDDGLVQRVTIGKLVGIIELKNVEQ